MVSLPASEETSQRQKIISGFFEAIRKFSYQNFFHHNEYVEDGVALHVPWFKAARERKFLPSLFFEAGTVTKAVYEEGRAYVPYTLRDFMCAVHGIKREKFPVADWKYIYPEVEQVIASHGDDVKESFLFLFDKCRNFQSACEKDNTVRQETHGLSDEDSQRLDRALQTVWQAFPFLDARILEGYEMVIGADPLVKRVFPRHSFGNFSRTDRGVAEMLRDGEGLEKNQVLQAQRYRDNFQEFKNFAPQIAEQCLARFLLQTVKLNAPETSWNHFPNQTALVCAKKVLDRVGEVGVLQVAKELYRGQYGQPLGERKWLRNDETREEALRSLLYAGAYLDFCMDVKTGGWFSDTDEYIAAEIQVASGEQPLKLDALEPAHP